MKSFNKALLIFFSMVIVGRCATVNEMKLLRGLLNESTYDMLARPGGENRQEDATNVLVSMYIRNIHYINSPNIELQLQLNFWMYWKDPRLAYNDKAGSIKYLMVPLDTIQDMWHPDVFFVNAKETEMQNTIYPDAYYRIYPTGRVVASKRVTLTLFCPMDFHYYPFDSQVCTIDFESFAFTADEIKLTWKDQSTNKSKAISKNAGLNSFTLSRLEKRDMTAHFPSGTYSRLSLNLYLDRSRGFFIIQFFLPTIGIVLVSWGIFFFSSYTTSLKIVLILVCLSMESLLIYINEADLPPTNYVLSFDIWNWVTMSTMFIELLLILKTGSDENIEKAARSSSADTSGHNFEEGEENEPAAVARIEDEANTCPNVCPQFIKNIAKKGPYESGKLVIPGLYLLTIAIYFLNYAT